MYMRATHIFTCNLITYLLVSSHIYLQLVYLLVTQIFNYMRATHTTHIPATDIFTCNSHIYLQLTYLLATHIFICIQAVLTEIQCELNPKP